MISALGTTREIINMLLGNQSNNEIADKLKEISKKGKLNEISKIEGGVEDNLDDIKNMSFEQSEQRFKAALSATEELDDGDVKENSEVKELSKEEIDEMQRKAIKEGLLKIIRGEVLTTEQLGNLGEMMMDQYYQSQGYEVLTKNRITGLDDKGHKGIDGVYEKTNADGSKEYVIADAKYGNAQLKVLSDGTRQMSENWIDERLDDAVGKEKADEIREAAEDNPDSVKHEVYHVNPKVNESGYVHSDITEVDSDGNKVGSNEVVEHYDKNGERINDN